MEGLLVGQLFAESRTGGSFRFDVVVVVWALDSGEILGEGLLWGFQFLGAQQGVVLFGR